jgi:uncharacterized phage-associated protein
MPYPVKAVANFFLDLAAEAKKPITPMQIQKLVYFAHGWHLALTGRALVDEQVEAWPYGPVFPSLYHEFKKFGSGAITGRATELSLEVNPKTGKRTILRSSIPSLDDAPATPEREYAKAVIARVWEVYGSWTAVQLSQMTHVPDGPWDITRRENPDRTGTDIADRHIEQYFRRKVAQEA